MIEYFHRQGSKNTIGEAKDYFELKSKVKSKGFLCFLIQNPDDKAIERMCKDYGFDEKPFKKFRTETRSLRYNFDPLTFTFTDYYTINEHIKISHLLFVIKDNLLILVASDVSPYYKELFKKILSKALESRKYSAGYILYQFLHQDAKENYDVLQSMDNKIAALEQKVLSDVQEKLLMHEIVALKKSLIQMSKRLWASSKVIFTIRKDLSSIKLSSEDMALLDDIYDTFVHQIDLIETQKETVTDYLEIFTTMISNRLAATSNELNMVMKKMAALTIIIMVPTLIAGIYGMNYKYMPELGWPLGYAFALTLMAVAAWTTYAVFHKKKWI